MGCCYICEFLQVNFFNGEKRTLGSKKNIGGLRTMSFVSHRPMQNTLLSEHKDFEDSVSRTNSSQHLGTAVKQLAPVDLQSSLILDKSNNGSSTTNASSVQLKRNLSMHHNKVWESWFSQAHLVRRFTSVAVLGCIFFASFRLTSMNVNRMKNASKCVPVKSNPHGSSVIWKTDSYMDNNLVPAYIKGDGIAGRLKKFLATVNLQFKTNSDAGNTQTSCPAANLSSMQTMSRTLMPMEEAEELVQQWQAIKGEALGPSHQVDSLSEILDESMLNQVSSSIVISTILCLLLI